MCGRSRLSLIGRTNLGDGPFFMALVISPEKLLIAAIFVVAVLLVLRFMRH